MCKVSYPPNSTILSIYSWSISQHESYDYIDISLSIDSLFRIEGYLSLHSKATKESPIAFVEKALEQLEETRETSVTQIESLNESIFTLAILGELSNHAFENKAEWNASSAFNWSYFNRTSSCHAGFVNSIDTWSSCTRSRIDFRRLYWEIEFHWLLRSFLCNVFNCEFRFCNIVFFEESTCKPCRSHSRSCPHGHATVLTRLLSIDPTQYKWAGRVCRFETRSATIQSQETKINSLAHEISINEVKFVFFVFSFFESIQY